MTRVRLAAGGLCAAVAITAAQAQTPNFRATTTLVTTDVIPRDASGRFVASLTAADFAVLEDGVPQTIESFALVQGGRTTNLLQAPVAAVEGIVVPRRNTAADVAAGRVLLIVVDDLHFEPEYTPHVRRLVEHLATSLLREGDLVAMASTGPSSIEIGGTRDRRMVASAVSKIRGSGLTASDMFQMPETSQGAADIRRRAQFAFKTAYGFLDELEQVRDRRKVVIYISGGYDFDPFAAGRQSADRVQGGRFADPTRFLVEKDNPYQRLPAVTADIDLHAYMRELTLAANRVNATMYTVDPRGLSGVVDAGQHLDQSEWRAFLQKTQSSLRFLAEQTGGYAVVNTNDFPREFKRIDAETSDYYLIGYYSTNADRAARVRALDVKVGRPGVTVSARSGYSLKSPDAPAVAQSGPMGMLGDGGLVLVMRHASSPREAPAPAHAAPGNDTLERQLDAAGRAGAEAFGKAVRAMNVPLDAVLTSPAFRAVETVKYAGLTKYRAVAELGDNAKSMQGVSDAQAAWLRARVAEKPARGNVLLVTHQPNLERAFPAWGGSVTEGEIVVLRPDGQGQAPIVGRIRIDEWLALGAASRRP